VVQLLDCLCINCGRQESMKVETCRGFLFIACGGQSIARRLPNSPTPSVVTKSAACQLANAQMRHRHRLNDAGQSSCSSSSTRCGIVLPSTCQLIYSLALSRYNSSLSTRSTAFRHGRNSRYHLCGGCGSRGDSRTREI